MGFEATMDRLGNDPALRAQPYELRVESSLPAAEVDRLLARRGEVTAVARVREIFMTGRGARRRSTRACSTGRSPPSRTRSATGAPRVRPARSRSGAGRSTRSTRGSANA